MGHEFPHAFSQKVWKKRWRDGSRSGLQVERSGFKTRLGHCVESEQDCILLQFPSPPRTQMFTIELSGWLHEIL